MTDDKAFDLRLANYVAGELRRTLPWHVRIELAVKRRIDHAAVWLVDHDRIKTAIALWKICRMW